MEKGFNDDELADIMNEIESLEKEFSSEEEDQNDDVKAHHETDAEHMAQPAAQAQEVEEDSEVEAAHAPIPEEKYEDDEVHMTSEAEMKEEMSEVLGELSKMEVEDVVPESKWDEENEEENLHHIQRGPEAKAHSKSGSHTAMSFHVEGDMKFELTFHIAGKFVGLTVSEDGLEIGLDGGAKFTLPVQEQSGFQKKAS